LLCSIAKFNASAFEGTLMLTIVSFRSANVKSANVKKTKCVL
jgi:hypothetical protein